MLTWSILLFYNIWSISWWHDCASQPANQPKRQHTLIWWSSFPLFFTPFTPLVWPIDLTGFSGLPHLPTDILPSAEMCHSVAPIALQATIMKVPVTMLWRQPLYGSQLWKEGSGVCWPRSDRVAGWRVGRSLCRDWSGEQPTPASSSHSQLPHSLPATRTISLSRRIQHRPLLATDFPVLPRASPCFPMLFTTHQTKKPLSSRIRASLSHPAGGQRSPQKLFSHSETL